MSWQAIFRHPINTQDDAAAFVSALGFCTWAPVPGIDVPNLADAMGETATSVLDRTWYWKDDLHLSRRIYYGKLIRGQPTFIAPDYLPVFIAALAGQDYPDERDPTALFDQGRLSWEARAIVNYLTDHPAEPSRSVRRATGLHRTERSASAERALVDLQRRFLICKVDLTGRGRGTYSYVWDLAERFWPEPFEEAADMATDNARDRIRQRLSAFGVATNAAIEQRLFLWRNSSLSQSRWANGETGPPPTVPP